MAVLVKKADGQSKRFADKDALRYEYRTTDSGVLRIIQLEGETQALAQEYSPAGWLEVRGARYHKEVGLQMKSSDEDPKPPVTSRMVVL